MAKQREKRTPRSRVQLVAYDANDGVVLKRAMSFDKFYEGKDELIDSGRFRRGKGIARVHGQVYDSGGELVEEFENQYAADGSYAHGKVRYKDGTVSED